MAAAAAAAAAARRLRLIGSQNVPAEISPMFRCVPTSKCYLTNCLPVSSHAKAEINGPMFRRVPTSKCCLTNCLPISSHSKYTNRSTSISQLILKPLQKPANQSISPFEKLSWRTVSTSHVFASHRMKIIFSEAALGIKDAIVHVLKMLFEWVKDKVLDHYFKYVASTIALILIYEILPKFGIHVDIEEWIRTTADSDELKEVWEVLNEIKDTVKVLHQKEKDTAKLEQEQAENRETLVELQKQVDCIKKELEAWIKALEEMQTKEPNHEDN